MSLPVRGAWIEIKSDKRELIEALCRSPCGERGLKSGLSFELPYCRFVAPRAGSVD